MQDDLLGPLEHDAELERYTAEWGDGDDAVLVHLDPDADGDVAPALERARQVFSDFARYAEGAKDHAVSALLDLKNGEWVDEDEGPVTADEFRRRMRLESVEIDPDGEVTFWHDDGDLFFGHSIEIVMNARDQFVDADIPG